MASQNDGVRRLDATSGRELVYCHACFLEWYRTGPDIDCPVCGSDITEIVNPDNDPREPEPLGSGYSSPELPYLREDYSDPEEADLEEHTGAHGFIHRRSNRYGPNQVPHHDASFDNVARRFYEMLHTFGPAQAPSGRESPDEMEGNQTAWRHFHPTTFPSDSLGGTASVTIFSGPPRRRTSPDTPSAEAFQAIFSSVLRDVGPPQDDQPNLPQGLHEILGLLNLLSPAHAMAGDAVYSQEALDRIITQLMEVNPQSNAAPPATQEALQSLERKSVDTDMLKGESRTECTICIDEMKIGDKVVILPCKHWFHEECVILWLKEHNTCPICRTPIEKTGSSSSGSHDGGEGDSEVGDSASGASGPSAPGSRRQAAGAQGVVRSWGASFGGRSSRHGANATARGSNGVTLRTGSTNGRASGLGEALRAITSIQQLRDGERGRGWQGGHGPVTTELSSRDRRRSPSENSRRPASQASGRQTSLGPLSWLRDRFSGGGGSQ